MASSIFISSGCGQSGKSLLAWCLGEIYREMGYKVGYFKPIGLQPVVVENGEITDQDAVLMQKVLQLDDPYRFICPIVIAQDLLEQIYQGQAQNLRRTVKESYKKIAQNKDIVIIKGLDNLCDGGTFGIDGFELAPYLNIKGLLINRFKTDISSIDLTMCYRKRLKERLGGTIINGVPVRKMDYVKNQLAPFLEKNGIKVFGVIPEDKLLHSMTLRKICEVLSGRVLCCGDKLDEVVENFLIGAMDLEHAVNFFRRVPNKVVITGGTRSDIIAAAMDTSTKGILLTGGYRPSQVVMGKAVEKDIPLILVDEDTYATVDKLDKAAISLDYEDKTRVRHFENLVRKHVDMTRLGQEFGIAPR